MGGGWGGGLLAPWKTPSENHIKAQITFHPHDATEKVMTFPKSRNVPLPPARAPLLAPLASHRSLGPDTNDMCRVFVTGHVPQCHIQWRHVGSVRAINPQTHHEALPSGHRPRTAELDPDFLKAGKTDSCQSLWVFCVPTKASDNVAFVLHRPLVLPTRLGEIRCSTGLPRFQGSCNAALRLNSSSFRLPHHHYHSEGYYCYYYYCPNYWTLYRGQGHLPWSKLSPSSTLLDKEDKLRAAYRITELWQKAGSAQ